MLLFYGFQCHMRGCLIRSLKQNPLGEEEINNYLQEQKGKLLPYQHMHNTYTEKHMPVR